MGIARLEKHLGILRALVNGDLGEGVVDDAANMKSKH